MASNMAEKVKYMIRISKALSEGEKISTATRKEKVKKGLAKLGIQCDEDKIPTIAVLGAGGAMRAMIALYGTLTELKKCNLLDCIMYLGGVSGSTWCMSVLYKNEDWAENIEALEKSQCENLVQDQWDVQKAINAVKEAAEDECYSLTDFWSYFLMYRLLNKLDETGLSAHRSSCENGKNPYPVYAAVDQITYMQQHAGTWFEFTPHEAGVPGLGAYVDTKYFGSVFENGQLTEERNERNICYLQGLWGSALGSKEELHNNITGALMNFLKQDSIRQLFSASENLDDDDQKLYVLFEGYHSVLEVQLLESKNETVQEKPFDHLENILKRYSSRRSYELVQEISKNWFSATAGTRKENCARMCEALDKDFGDFTSDFHRAFYDVVKKTYKCLLDWTWGSTKNFLYHCSDVEFPDLTSKPVVSLIDAGLAINAAYPPLLQSERQVKLIICFDTSAGDPFLTIKNTIEYCETHGIPFPKIDKRELEDIDNPSDCYIFRGDGEHVPTVIHCPLFNQVNCPGKIAEYREQFSTFKMNYSREEIEKLLIAAKKNVTNVQQKILEEINYVIGPSSQMA